MTAADKTRDRRYKERQRERGLVQVLVWVPAASAAALKAFAASLRKDSPPSGNTGGIPPHPKLPFPQDDQ